MARDPIPSDVHLYGWQSDLKGVHPDSRSPYKKKRNNTPAWVDKMNGLGRLARRVTVRSQHRKKKSSWALMIVRVVEKTDE
jgi:hypothetical protein